MHDVRNNGSRGRRWAVGLAFSVSLPTGALTSCAPEPTPSAGESTAIEDDTTWEILSLDQTEDGDLWATSRRGLHRSDDDGGTWVRVAELDPAHWAGLAFPDSSGAYLHCWRTRAVWNAMTGETTPIETLGPIELRGELRRGDVWIAHGYDETRDAAQPAHSSTGPPLSNSGVTGCTACSVDGGRNWSLIDTYDGAAVMDAHLEDDNTLTLLLTDFGVRQGRLVLEEPGGPRAEMKTLIEPRELISPRSWWHYRVFIDGERGWMSANHHHLGGGAHFETADRGSSWKLLSEEEQPVVEFHRLGDGRWLKIEEPFPGDPSRLFSWIGDRFVELTYPPTLCPWEIDQAVVSAAGDLLVLLSRGELWVYEGDLDAWKRLWIEPTGGARISPR